MIQEPKKWGRKPNGTEAATPIISVAPAMTIEEAFKPDQVACMICGKKGMKTLKRHLI
ncbi:MAG: MucR family transcriptional regulator [Syntrophales bacterium]